MKGVFKTFSAGFMMVPRRLQKTDRSVCDSCSAMPQTGVGAPLRPESGCGRRKTQPQILSASFPEGIPGNATVRGGIYRFVHWNPSLDSPRCVNTKFIKGIFFYCCWIKRRRRRSCADKAALGAPLERVPFLQPKEM